ncbi:MAG: tetratricopeptide repeat protein [Candidatus Helarchaeota archaeon]
MEKFKKQIFPQEISISEIDALLFPNNIVQNKKPTDPKINFQQQPFSIYYKIIEDTSDAPNFSRTLIDYFKFLLEYAKDHKDPFSKINLNEAITIDLTNCPEPLFAVLYFIALKNYDPSKFQDFDVICWTQDIPFSLPIQFLDSTSQLFLDLISTGNSTIKELQHAYSNNKNLDKIVSQPFISKYISQLLKLHLIQEEWIEGLKHFYLSPYGAIHTSSTLQLKISKKFSKKPTATLDTYSTSDLIQKLIVSYRSKDMQMVDLYLDELLLRPDLSEKDFLTIFNKLAGYHHPKLKTLLEKGIKLIPSSSSLHSKLAQYYFDENNFPLAFQLCKHAIQLDPNSPLAWELLGKLSALRN